jgi:hypothetical protein
MIMTGWEGFNEGRRNKRGNTKLVESERKGNFIMKDSMMNEV